MRQILVGTVVMIAAFAVVFVVRQGSTLPAAAVLAYEFKAGTTATYDVGLVVTNTVASGATTATSHTRLAVATHAAVLSTTSTGAGLVRISVDQPTISVDGVPVPAHLKVTSAEVRLSPNGQVESVTYPGTARTIAVLRRGNTPSDANVRVGTLTAQGGSDPLQGLLLLAQGSLPALPGGTIGVGTIWSRQSLINAPYMLLEQAIAHSRLDGFERDNDITVARVRTVSTAPIDLQTYQSPGSPLHVTGAQSVRMLAYFAPDLHVLLRTMGQGHVDMTQTVSAGSPASRVGMLRVTTPPVHTITDIAFTARLRQP